MGSIGAWIPADPREGWIFDPLKWIPGPKMDPLPSQIAERIAKLKIVVATLCAAPTWLSAVCP
jgi:hypothetical protein